MRASGWTYTPMVTINGGLLAKHSNDILTWARRGAEARWTELQAEVAALVKAFPHLNSLSRSTQRAVGSAARNVADTVDPPRRRSKMTAAQRKAVSARMKKYWAARRKAKS